MLKDVGLVVSCGRWRLEKQVKSSVILNFATSVEVPESESSVAIAELRESIQEVVSRWSRIRWAKKKYQLKEIKKVKHGV